MPSEQVTYEQLAERLGITREAARAIVKRQRLPRSKGNDGKTLVTVDLDELRHKPMSGRSPGGDPAVTTTITTLKARIESFEAELAAERVRAADESVARKVVPTVLGAPGTVEIGLANQNNAAVGLDGMVTDVDFEIAKMTKDHTQRDGAGRLTGPHSKVQESGNGKTVAPRRV